MMSDHPPHIQSYWQEFISTLPQDADAPTHFAVEPFGDSAEMANDLGQLVVSGVKTATCSALWEWQAEDEAIPAVGLHSIVIDGNGNPMCIIKTVEVNITPYNEVTAQFAADEGEGDRSLAYWRRVHWEFFSRSLPKIGKQPTQDMPLVCERFEVVFRK